jgi:ribosomal peptide maturation radical SAM protein 1
MKHIALISTPWPLFNRPSIQLGALKAFIARRLPKNKTDTLHFYLNIAAAIGYRRYQSIAETTWLAESPYAALLFPQRRAIIERFWQQRYRRSFQVDSVVFPGLCRQLERLTSHLTHQIDWSRYLLAGFSICFGQLTSTLYFIRQIKKHVPSLRIVLGGSACAGDLGISLIRTFPEIDFVIQGEGELPLISLIQTLMDEPQPTQNLCIPGLLTRQTPSGNGLGGQLASLDDLPVPEYDDYFETLKALAPEKRFFPKIPLEMSRGCWWNRSIRENDGKGCAFCNLNLQWSGYRMKSHDRVIAELEGLTDRYEILSVSFMDNLLPPHGLETLFDRIRSLDKDFNLFAEVRANTPFAVLHAMATAGMHELQVGIESLSSSLLKKMNKGTRVIDNLEIMKNCEMSYFPSLTANLILNFPSSDEYDVSETLTNLKFALPFRPIKGIPFWLGYMSPVWCQPEAYGIKGLRKHPFFGRLFPQDLLRKLEFVIQGYWGGIRRQNRLWQPVRSKIEEWNRRYLDLHRSPAAGPILSYQDGGKFMIIKERCLGKDALTHRLRESSRRIYLFCTTQKTMPQILSKFPGLGEEKVRPFLNMMVAKRLMFTEQDRFLSLAVPAHERFVRTD